MNLSAIIQKLSHAFAFIWILTNGIFRGSFACQSEFKSISEDVTLTCSRLSIAEPIAWLFNNRSQVNSSFSESVSISKPYGRSLVISSHDVAVYGDYSCSYGNGTLINCFSLYIQGNCNDLCARLTVNSSTTDFYQNSNVTFYSTIEINLLAPLTAADELGVFRFLKDGDGINNFSRISHTAINSPNISFYILNAQLSDSGVYQFVYLSSHAELYTNRVSIDVHPIASSTIITKSVAITPTASIAFTTMRITPTSMYTVKDSNDNKLIGLIVGVVIGAVVLLAGIIIGIIIACKIWRRHKSSRHPTQVQNTDEIASTDQSVHLQRVLTETNIPTGQADEQEHTQFN